MLQRLSSDSTSRLLLLLLVKQLSNSCNTDDDDDDDDDDLGTRNYHNIWVLSPFGSVSSNFSLKAIQ